MNVDKGKESQGQSQSGGEESEELIKTNVCDDDDVSGVSQTKTPNTALSAPNSSWSPGASSNGKKNNEGTSRFPYSVAFIVGNEFCERFSFYGMKAILPIYLTAWLSFSENKATTVIHLFNFSAYFFALFGGILSDNMLGKYKTILYLSMVYCVGNAAMSFTALPGITGTPPHWWGILISLTLIALGTGGIKPCVASFGGNQFDPSQERELSIFFSVFYFAINAGSVLSMFITPLLRKDVHCFGQDSCYSLAFGVPAVLMLVALIIFVSGSHLYRKEPARSNVVLHFFALVATAFARRVANLFKGILRSESRYPEEEQTATGTAAATPTAHNHHWLYLASDKYEAGFIEDSRSVLSVFAVFCSVCIFWALYDQQGSLWVYQALMMRSDVVLFGWRVTIIPEQMGLANAVMILVLIPVFSYVVYPLCNALHIPMRPLVRIFLGMLFAALSFIVAGLLQLVMTSRNQLVASPADPDMFLYVSGDVSVLWQLPQYFLITCAELLLSITGLEFAYSQAPASMKSVCQAGWLLTVAGGNLIVIIVTLINPVGWVSPANQMAGKFFLWSGIMVVGALLFAILARNYDYREERLVIIDANETILSPIESAKSRNSFQSDTPLLKGQHARL